MPVLVSLGLGSAPAAGCLLLATALGRCCVGAFVVFVGILHVLCALASLFFFCLTVFYYLISVLCLPPFPAWVWQVGDVRRLLPSQQILLEDQSLS